LNRWSLLRKSKVAHCQPAIRQKALKTFNPFGIVCQNWHAEDVALTTPASRPASLKNQNVPIFDFRPIPVSESWKQKGR
jgi:hypothetical protein